MAKLTVKFPCPYQNIQFVWKLACCLVIVLLAAQRLWAQSQRLGLTMDEQNFVQRATYLDFVATDKFTDPVWQKAEAYDQPLLAMYLYGIALRLHSGTTVQTFLQSKPGFSLETPQEKWLDHWNVRYSSWPFTTWQTLPSEIATRAEPILIARTVSVILGVLCIVLILLIGYASGHWLWGLCWAVFWEFNLLFVNTIPLATGDAALLINMLAAAFCLSMFLRKNSRSWLWLASAGVCVGLATSAKLNGVFMLIFIQYFLVASYFVSSAPKNIRTLFKQLGLVFVTSLGVFILLNPYLWPNISTNLQKMFQHRANTIEYQQQVFDSPLKTLPQRLQATWQHTLSLTAEEENQSWQSFWVLNLGVAGVGLWQVLRSLPKKHCTHFSSPQLLGFWHLSWLGGWAILTTGLIPMDWSRYYIPIVLAVCGLQAYGLSTLLQLTKKRLYFHKTL